MKISRRRLLLVIGLVTAVYLSHPLWQPVPMHRGQSVRDWVLQATGSLNEEAHRVVVSELRERAVPDIIRELEACCHSKLYYRMREWQNRLPAWCRFPPEEEDTSISVDIAASVLADMGEPARPAIPALVRCVDQADMRFAEWQDVVGSIVSLGPVASEALPLLRRMASDPRHRWSVQAALAVFNADGSTNLLIQTINRTLAKPDGFRDFDRELFWFRTDEQLNRVVVPLLTTVLTNETGPILDRISIAWYLGEVRIADPLAEDALKLLLKQKPYADLRKTALESLQKLERARANAGAVKEK